MLYNDITGVIKMLTIKELAEKLDVTPMTIHRNKPKEMEFIQKGKVNYIDSNLEKAITKKVKDNQRIYNKKKTTKTEDQSELVKQLKDEIEYLKTQIKVKDDQLERKDKLLDQQQQLNLKTMTKIEELEQPKDNEENKEDYTSEKDEPRNQKTFWNKLFGK